jgi:diguanylate cyclase (GGDEF)-like protein/PAS domain S-box-containing protein
VKWNLRSKLHASLAAAFGLLIFEAGVSQWAIWHVHADVERLASQTPITRYSRDLVDALAAESNIVAGYAQNHDASILAGRAENVARQSLALSGLTTSASDSKYLAPLIAELLAERSTFRHELDEEVTATQQHHPALASWLMVHTQDELGMLRSSSDAISDTVASDILAASTEYRAATQQATLLTIIAISGATLVFGLIAGTFGRSIHRRLGAVSVRMSSLATELSGAQRLEGERLADLRWTPLDESGDDELSQLAQGSNQLVQRLIATGNALFEQQQRLKATLSSITDAVIRTRPDGFVDYMNPAAIDMFEYHAAEGYQPHISELFAFEADANGIPDPLSHCLEAHGTVVALPHARLRLPQGRVLDVSCSVSPLYSREGAIRGTVIALRDITEQRALAMQLAHQATHDSLTGLANRRRLEAELEIALTGAAADGRQHALLYIDVDQFKVVNDTCGHAAGDELLCRLTGIFSPLMQAHDLLARIGGDEFAILLTDRSLQQAEQFANDVRETVAKSSFTWHEQRFPLAVSVGVAPITADSVSVATIMSAVDAACYAAKDGGRNRVRIYAERDIELARTFGEMHWVARINRAVSENRLRLYYQPIRAIPITSNEIHHVEILLRMVDEDNKIITPIEFLPAAERYNLMPMIDRWVISNALPQCARLIEKGALKMAAINLSDASLRNEGLTRFLQMQISSSGIDPRALCFEISETVAVTNAERVAHLMQEVRALGCRFALDDFGNGMSSFGLLKRLPIDYLKIDGSFVKGIAEDRIDYAMVEAIHRVGHVMGIKTVAEYVSKQQIADRLADIGVDYGQGYALGRPAPLSDLLATIRGDERRLRVVTSDHLKAV